MWILTPPIRYLVKIKACGLTKSWGGGCLSLMEDTNCNPFPGYQSKLESSVSMGLLRAHLGVAQKKEGKKSCVWWAGGATSRLRYSSQLLNKGRPTQSRDTHLGFSEIFFSKISNLETNLLHPPLLWTLQTIWSLFCDHFQALMQLRNIHAWKLHHNPESSILSIIELVRK